MRLRQAALTNRRPATRGDVRVRSRLPNRNRVAMAPRTRAARSPGSPSHTTRRPPTPSPGFSGLPARPRAPTNGPSLGVHTRSENGLVPSGGRAEDGPGRRGRAVGVPLADALEPRAWAEASAHEAHRRSPGGAGANGDPAASPPLNLDASLTSPHGTRVKRCSSSGRSSGVMASRSAVPSRSPVSTARKSSVGHTVQSLPCSRKEPCLRPLAFPGVREPSPPQRPRVSRPRPARSSPGRRGR